MLANLELRNSVESNHAPAAPEQIFTRPSRDEPQSRRLLPMKLRRLSAAPLTNGPLMRHLAVITLLAFAALLAVGALATRIDILLHRDYLRGVIQSLEWLVLAVSTLWLAKTRPLLLAALWSFLIAVIAHSFCNLYWPSLRPGVPVQDYLLTDQVSSHYSFNLAKVYWRHIALVLLSSSAAASAYAAVSPTKQRQFKWLLGTVFALAFAVVALQTFYNLNFLAAGSGTAMIARRAPGLFEDSGASTVYYAALISGMFFLALFGPFTLKERILWVAATITATAFAYGTGGRIFFVSILVSGFVAVSLAGTDLLLRIRRKHSYQQHLLILGAATILVGIGFRASSQMRKVWTAFDIPHSLSRQGLWIWLTQLGNRIDPIRAVHMKVMLRAFIRHPWFGTGLGSFHVNYYEHLDWALATGGNKYADPPASFFLMIASELGLAGVVLIVVGCCLLVRAARLMLRASIGDGGLTKAQAAWQCAGVGILISLCCSFLIGAHLLFLSASSLLALGLFAITYPRHDPSIKRRWAARVLFSCALLLLTHCVILFCTAPRVPQFRWSVRGQAQVPVSPSVPIGTQGFVGGWIPSGGEVLYVGLPVRIFVEMPPEFYPLKVTATFVDQSGSELAISDYVVEAYDPHQPWRTFDLTTDRAAGCADSIGPEHFCSVRIVTKPVWSWDGQKMGFFLVKTAG